jgi:hypothetical protein
MRTVAVLLMLVGVLVPVRPTAAEDQGLERLLRAQVFNKEFEGFARYHVAIEADRLQPDGSREVIAVASGMFGDHRQRVKALILIVGEQVWGGQVLEKDGLPPCSPSPQPHTLGS